MKVLIAFGSRFGSSEEISSKIAKTLENEGLVVQVTDLQKIKEKEWPSVEDYDGVLIGSGIKVGNWTKAAKTFLMNNKEIFQSRKRILGIFVSSGDASNPAKHAKAKKEYIEDIIKGEGIEADIFDAFGGIFDFSKSTRMGFLDRKIMGMLTKNDKVLNIKPRVKNDLRDWNQIQHFAEDFAQMIKKEKIES